MNIHNRAISSMALSVFILFSNSNCRLLNVDYDSFNSQIKKSNFAACQTHGIDTIYCKSNIGKNFNFVNWQIPETKISDGDGVEYEYLGKLNKNTNFSIIMAKFNHDSPAYIFYDQRNGGIIVANPGADPLYMSSDCDTLIIQRNFETNREETEIWINLHGIVDKYSCKTISGKIFIDSSLKYQNLSMKNFIVDFVKSENRDGIKCNKSNSPFLYDIPKYMKRKLSK